MLHVHTLGHVHTHEDRGQSLLKLQHGVINARWPTSAVMTRSMEAWDVSLTSAILFEVASTLTRLGSRTSCHGAPAYPCGHKVLRSPVQTYIGFLPSACSAHAQAMDAEVFLRCSPVKVCVSDWASLHLSEVVPMCVPCIVCSNIRVHRMT